MLRMHHDWLCSERVLQLKADGYLVKNGGRDELILAIRNVHEGQRHFASALVESLMGQRAEARSADRGAEGPQRTRGRGAQCIG